MKVSRTRICETYPPAVPPSTDRMWAVTISLASEATFVARSIDTDPKHLGEVLKRAAEQKPQDVDVAWHLALTCYYMGIRVLDDSDEKKRMFLEGRETALAAIERAPDRRVITRRARDHRDQA